MPGSVILLSGDPGIGKSTLALQLAENFERTLYIGAEESPAQIKLRADRLGIANDRILLTTDGRLDRLGNLVDEEKPDLLIVDSIQTVRVESTGTGSLGPVNQVREAAALIIRVCKDKGLPCLIIGHVTKTGDVAGPMLLEHLVDVVLLMESDPSGGFRVLRGLKNRYGTTDETGIFVMTEKGILDLNEPSQILLPGGTSSRPGSAAVVSMEGRRPLALELQALTVSTSFGLPKRVATGIDPNRLAMLLAVLERRGGISCGKEDVYLNTAGGFRLKETAVDLGVIAAVGSSIKDVAVPEKTIFIGEVGLAGEIRPANRIDLRLKEAVALGFTRAYIPNQKVESSLNIEVQKIKTVRNLDWLFNG